VWPHRSLQPERLRVTIGAAQARSTTAPTASGTQTTVTSPKGKTGAVAITQ
jgi:hypothetical protein